MQVLLRSLLDKLPEYTGKQITTYGRIGSVGKRKTFYFIQLRAGNTTDELKIILSKDLLTETPTLFSTLQVQGEIVQSPDGKTHELQVEKVLFYGAFSPEDVEIPHLQRGQVEMDVLRKITSQRLLTKPYQAIMLTWERVETLLHRVSEEHDLMKVRAPFITFSDCEGAGETFSLSCDIPDFFKQKATLTVSGQVDEETITSRFLCPTYIYLDLVFGQIHLKPDGTLVNSIIMNLKFHF